MKKKIRLLLCILMTVLCFTGCSGTSDEVQYDTATMQEIAEVVISSFVSMTDEDFQTYKDLTQYQMDYVMMNAGLRIEATDFVSMIYSWEAGLEECGAYISHDEMKVEVTNDGVAITTEAEYEKRNATLTFKFSEDSYLESMDISAKYSLSEILTKAGMNTFLGMGTVFAVLIFLAFLIFMMKYIPGAKGLINKSENNFQEEEKLTENIPVIHSSDSLDVTDDLELIAVITAAIAMQTGTGADGFVVRSIRRRPSNKWK